MGGINHQPTTHPSNVLTVPMSRALSEIGKAIFEANIGVEDAIGTESVMAFAAGQAFLDGTVKVLDCALSQIGVFSGYVGKVLEVLGGGQYEPFRPVDSLDLSAFYAQLVDTGLAPDSAAAREAIETLREGGYTATFESYMTAAALLGEQITVLRDLTADMRDGCVSYQGMFWYMVETNKSPWRQAFALVLTQFTELLMSFQTSALVSTETFLRGADQSGLLTNVGQVTIATRNAASPAV